MGETFGWALVNKETGEIVSEQGMYVTYEARSAARENKTRTEKVVRIRIEQV